MKRRAAILACLVLSLAVALPLPVFAQGGEAERPLEIKKVNSGKLPTPEYQVKRGNQNSRSREWFGVEVIYDTAPEWVDEATFTFYILTRSKNPPQGRPPVSLFKGEVTYMNVMRGRHKADMWLHPSALARFGEVERVAVLVSVGGRMVAADGIPSGSTAQRWWEQLSPREDLMLNRMQTPFAMMNFDDYEMIKPK